VGDGDDRQLLRGERRSATAPADLLDGLGEPGLAAGQPELLLRPPPAVGPHLGRQLGVADDLHERVGGGPDVLRRVQPPARL